MSADLSPVLKYPGAKWRISDWIVSQMPVHEVYLEPYFGSGAVFFRKAPAEVETINDIHGDVVNLFRVVRDHAEELYALLESTPYAREEYELSRAEPRTGEPVEDARRFMVRCWQTISGSDRYANGWRYRKSLNRWGSCTREWREVRERVFRARDRLQDAQIECRPAVEVIRAHSDPGVLIYADPPYLRAARTRPAGRGGNHYRNRYVHEMTDEQHVELLEALLAHGGAVLLSGYDCELYNSHLVGWTRAELQVLAEGAQRRTEVLWLNPVAARGRQLRLFDGMEAVS